MFNDGIKQLDEGHNVIESYEILDVIIYIELMHTFCLMVCHAIQLLTYSNKPHN